MRIWTLAATAIALGTLHAAPLAIAEDAPIKAPAAEAPAAEAPAAETPAEKPIEVRICPISNMEVKGEGAGSRRVKNYKAYFCWGSHLAPFDALSPAEKETKILEALKIQTEAAKAKAKAK